MMNKMKRMLALVLAFVMVLSLAACGKEVDETKAPEQTDAAEQTNAPEQTDAPEVTYDPWEKYEETVTVTFGNMLRGDTTAADGTTITATDNALLDAIKEMLNIEIERELEAAAEADYTSALSLALTATEIPDITVVYDYNQLCEMVEADMIWDLTEIVENYASEGTKKLWDGYRTDTFDVLDKVTFDGKIMALPRIANESGAFVWIRQDWLDKLGITIDEDGDKLITIDELEMVATEFVKNDPGNSGNPVGFALTADAATGSGFRVNMVASAFGAYPWYWCEQEDGSIVNGVTTPEMKEALAWWSDMYDKGLLDSQFGVTKADDIKAMMINGQLGIGFGSLNINNWYFNNTYSADENAEFTAYAIDNGSGKATFGSSDSQKRFVVVSKDCEHPEVAMKLYNFMAEGLCRNFDTEEIKENYPEFYKYFVDLADNGQGHFVTYEPLNMSCALSNVYDEAVANVEAWKAGTVAKEDVTDTTAIEYIGAFEDVAGGAPSVSSRVKADTYNCTKTWVEVLGDGTFEVAYHLSPPVTEEIALYYAELKTLGEEMQIKIITGEESIDYFDTFVEEWNNRGGQEIVDGLEEFYK